MPEEKKDEKSPYGQYTIEDVVAVEAGHYYIQVGSEIYAHNEKMAFVRDRTEALYDSIFEDLTAMKKHGTKRQKKDAEICLMHLKIFPMRIH